MLFKQHPLVRQWTELNAPFASNSNRGPTEGPRWIIDWKGPLFVSAVHAVDHERNGAWKNTDAGTGGLAMALSNVVGCSRGAVTRSVPMMGDANWDEYHPLKAQREKLEHVGDLRGLTPSRVFRATPGWRQTLHQPLAASVKLLRQTPTNQVGIQVIHQTSR